jgi:hypothetical protein
VAVVALTTWCLRRFGQTSAVVLAVLLIGNPFFLRYLTEARGTTWSMATAVLATLALSSFVRRPRRAMALAYGGAIGAGIALNTMSALLVPAHLAAVVLAGVPLRPLWRESFPAVAVAGVVVVPFVPALLGRSGTQVSWIPRLGPRGLAETSLQLMGAQVWGGPVGWVAPLFVVVGVAVAAVGLLAGLRGGLRSGRPDVDRALVLCTATMPPVLLATVSLVRPLFVARYLAPSAPFLVLAAALGLLSLPWRAVGVPVAAAGAAIAVALAFLVSGPTSDEQRPEDLRAAAGYLAEQVEPTDRVVFTPAWSRIAMARYWEPPSVTDAGLVRWPRSRLYPEEHHTERFVAGLEGPGRVVWVGTASELDWTPTEDPLAPIRSDMATWPVLEERRFGELVVRTCVPPG